MFKYCLSLILLASPCMAATTYTMDSRTVPTIQYSTPTTGATVTIGSTGSTRLLLNPAGSLVALTIAFPSTPTDGDIVQMGSSQTITTVTMSNGTVIGPLTTMAIGTFATYVYSSTTSSWFRIG
jgi:hypothetical protein